MAGKGNPPSGGGIDPRIKALLDNISERVDVLSDRRGDPLDRALTPRDLLDLGLAKRIGKSAQRLVSGGNLVLGDGPANSAIPPAPTGFEVSGGLSHIFLEWDNAREAYGNHGYTAIFRNSVDNLANAIEVAQTTSSFNHADMDVQFGVNYYYWIRFVSTSNVMGPPNSPVGTLGKVAEDPAELLERLSGEIGRTQLAEDLRTEIDDIADDIAALELVYGDTVSAAQAAADAAAAAADALGARADAVQAKTDAIAAQVAAVNAKNIAIVEAGNALTKANEASASAITASTAGATATSKASEAASSATSSAGSAANAQASAEVAVTMAAESENSATAAASSASSASISATNAGTSAAAANSSKLAAETALAGAQAAQIAAVSAKNDAEGAASSASSSATLAVNSKNDAAGSATAAASSASSAFTSATNAGTSAGAANQSKLDAQSALSGAQAAQSAAVTARDDAVSSAAAANSSASLAATSKNDAAGSATAAATSATNAATNASAAGTSATAANQSKLDAQAANSSAQAAQSAAVSAKNSAEGAATLAGTYLGFTVEYRNSALDYANAASTSASTAQTQATNASTSASAANAAKVAAESARDAALGSASAASTSATTASTKADEAATWASAASTSASTATTKASEALTYRNQAATSESNAAGYAAASAVDYTAITARLNNVGGLTIEQKFDAQASSITGLYGQYTLKIDVNGRVSGYGLASTSTASTFIINADSFAVAKPGATGSDIYPFIVDTTTGAVVMEGAFIKNATIGTAQIGTGVITSAKIVDGAIITAKISDAAITTAKITDAAITGAKIQDAAIGSAKIANVIQSSNYSSGVAGWKIEKSGAAEFNGIVISRANVVASGTTTLPAGFQFYKNYIGPTSVFPYRWVERQQVDYISDGGGGYVEVTTNKEADVNNFYRDFIIDTTFIESQDILNLSSASFLARAEISGSTVSYDPPTWSAGESIFYASVDCAVEFRTHYSSDGTGITPESSRRIFIRVRVKLSDILPRANAVRINAIKWALHRLT